MGVMGRSVLAAVFGMLGIGPRPRREPELEEPALVVPELSREELEAELQRGEDVAVLRVVNFKGRPSELSRTIRLRDVQGPPLTEMPYDEAEEFKRKLREREQRPRAVAPARRVTVDAEKMLQVDAQRSARARRRLRHREGRGVTR